MCSPDLTEKSSALLESESREEFYFARVLALEAERNQLAKDKSKLQCELNTAADKLGSTIAYWKERLGGTIAYWKERLRDAQDAGARQDTEAFRNLFAAIHELKTERDQARGERDMFETYWINTWHLLEAEPSHIAREAEALAADAVWNLQHPGNYMPRLANEKD
jgi:hypothetical protein